VYLKDGDDQFHEMILWYSFQLKLILRNQRELEICYCMLLQPCARTHAQAKYALRKMLLYA